MSLKEKVIEHLQSDRRKSMKIVAGKDSPLNGQEIYWQPVMALEMEKIMTLSGGGTNSKDYHVWTIIEKAEEENGQKIFTLEDKSLLERLEWKIVSSISNKMHDHLTFDEAKKNSQITPS